MPLWLRIVLLVLVAAWSFYCGHRLEARLHAGLVRMAGRSALRAVAVAVGYYLLQFVAYGIFGVVAAALYPHVPAAVVVVVLLVGLALVSPFLWCLGPQGMYGVGSSTAAGDLSKHGATRGVARGLAFTGLPMFFVTFGFGAMSTGIFVLILT